MYEFIQDEIFEELIEEGVEYLVVFGSAFVVLWLLIGPFLRRRKIQAVRRAGPRQWLDEVLWSFVAMVGATMLGLSLLWTESLSPLIDLSASPWYVGAVGLFVMLVVNDTWFYWLHRWLHSNKWAYRKIHLIHHGSRDVTPLAGQRFHPIELFLIPLPNAALPVIFLLNEPWYVAGFIFSLANNVYAHGGYELLPTFWERIPILRHKTTSLHHNMHHERVRGNYALYFTWWDRWMGTEFSDYDEVRAELNDRIRGRQPVGAAGVTGAVTPAPTTGDR
ncbi:MAG: sterol desaturase family protein [Actinomycetota bacterium]